MGIIGQLPVMDIILILGSLSMIMGSVFAIFQKQIKRMVAYSSVAQMGYVFLGIGLGTEFGVTIAIFHMIGHAVTKSILCLSVGAMVEKTGSNEIGGLRGIGKEMPITSALFVLGALSMTGIPLLPGFVSKWNLALASIGVNKVIIVGVILVSSLLNAAHYFPIIINFFFGEENLQDKVYKAKAKSIKEILPIICLVVAMIYIGFASGEIISLIKTSII
ncbi:Na(+)/H(+) antiporter subunit D [bioreactor metagenome]|uniref:Na(+)/H(+) antiporter subunit D n=1 Tax=bioreactor metagenome TaxID=1076179 RepID=A0A645HBN2_9ZZZZ